MKEDKENSEFHGGEKEEVQDAPEKPALAGARKTIAVMHGTRFPAHDEICTCDSGPVSDLAKVYGLPDTFLSTGYPYLFRDSIASLSG